MIGAKITSKYKNIIIIPAVRANLLFLNLLIFLFNREGAAFDDFSIFILSCFILEFIRTPL
jgi:hypothetical protein